MEKQILSLNDVARLLNRSVGATRNLVLRRQIPFRKVAGRLVFLADEINQWIEQAPGVRLEELLGRRDPVSGRPAEGGGAPDLSPRSRRSRQGREYGFLRAME